jgi:hypothetical protein
MDHRVQWLTCPNCGGRLEPGAGIYGDLECRACSTFVTLVDGEVLYTEPMRPGTIHRCTIERMRYAGGEPPTATSAVPRCSLISPTPSSP